ncbi:MAG: glycerate kinase [Candidatus Delongbacteria bacterium]|nr:glycerate kinase [Candidatus Delongbacteria bacterium]
MIRTIMLAPDSFKESLSADQFCRIAGSVIQQEMPGCRIWEMPISDGGEGFVRGLIRAGLGIRQTRIVTGPYRQPVTAEWAWREEDRTAIIEMASASGLERTNPDQRDTKSATSYGTGELIRAALDHEARTIYLGIGGSATTDGGVGIAAALGYRFFDAQGASFIPVGADLNRVCRIDPQHMDPRLSTTPLMVACDVTNPLLGPSGSARVYAPQKGATEQDIEQLEQNLAWLAQRVCELTGHDYSHHPGAGAAGGAGFGLTSLLNAQLEPGIDWFLKAVRFSCLLPDTDLIITGEGCLDSQLDDGKSIHGILKAAAEAAVPVIIICGTNRLGPEIYHQYPHLRGIFPILQQPLSLPKTLSHAENWLDFTLRSVIRLIH